MSNWLEVTLRSVGAFIILLVAARLLGKRTIAQMTYFDFVASITLGGMAANMTFDVKIPTIDNILAITIFSLTVITASFLSLKSRKLRSLIAGKPTVVMENGKILEKNMKQLRYTLDQLNQQLRKKDVFNPADVEFAILEPSGDLSISKKAGGSDQKGHQKGEQLNLPPLLAKSKIPIELLMDGEVIENNLKENGLTMEWLEQQLTNRGLTLATSNYAVLGTDRKLYVDGFDDKLGHRE